MEKYYPVSSGTAVADIPEFLDVRNPDDAELLLIFEDTMRALTEEQRSALLDTPWNTDMDY